MAVIINSSPVAINADFVINGETVTILVNPGRQNITGGAILATEDPYLYWEDTEVSSTVYNVTTLYELLISFNTSIDSDDLIVVSTGNYKFVKVTDGEDLTTVNGLKLKIVDGDKSLILALADNIIAMRDAALTNHTHTASQISDSTTAGRALLVAVDVAAQLTALALTTVIKQADLNITDTATNIGNIASTINTTGKYTGKLVWDSTNNRMMRAMGSTASSAWKTMAGDVTVTPA